MNRSFPFRPADNAAAAAWVTNGLLGFAESVVSIVAAGFPAYARIYHPARGTINEVLSLKEISMKLDLVLFLWVIPGSHQRAARPGLCRHWRTCCYSIFICKQMFFT